MFSIKNHKIAMAIGISIPTVFLFAVFTLLNPKTEVQTAQAEKVITTPPTFSQARKEDVTYADLPESVKKCLPPGKSWSELQASKEIESEGIQYYGLIVLPINQGESKVEPVISFNLITVEDEQCKTLHVEGRNWSELIPQPLANEFKEFWWSEFSQRYPDQFQKMISIPSEVALPFFPEDQKAIASQGKEIKVRIFENNDDYFKYTYDNDPYTLKNYRRVKERAKELGIE